MKKILFDKYIVMLLMVLLIIPSIIACGKKEEDYRQIQVYKIDGTATVARQGSNMDAYENMQLQSGDIVETVADSYLQLKLDEDKYVLVEPDSKISLQATGNSVDSKTKIYLEKGAIVNQLDNPLSEDSSYEVTTPNSTMAVRGTTFRVEITYDEKGESYAKVAVYGGKVECNLVFPDGTITEPVMVEAGTEVLVWGDDVESDYIWSGNTSYEELRLKVIDFLGVIIDRGEELSISKEEIESLKEAKEALENEVGEEEPVDEEPIEGLNEDDSLTEESTEKKESLEESKEEKTEQTTIQTPETTQPTPPSSDSSDSSGGSDSSDDDSSSGGNTSGGNNAPSDGESNGGNGSSSGGGNTSSIEVEFQYGNGIFAQGSLPISDNLVSVPCPSLKPDLNGNWVIEILSESNGTSEGDASVEGEKISQTLDFGGTLKIDVTNMQKLVFTWDKPE